MACSLLTQKTARHLVLTMPNPHLNPLTLHLQCSSLQRLVRVLHGVLVAEQSYSSTMHHLHTLLAIDEEVHTSITCSHTPTATLARPCPMHDSALTSHPLHSLRGTLDDVGYEPECSGSYRGVGAGTAAAPSAGAKGARACLGASGGGLRSTRGGELDQRSPRLSGDSRGSGWGSASDAATGGAASPALSSASGSVSGDAASGGAAPRGSASGVVSPYSGHCVSPPLLAQEDVDVRCTCGGRKHDSRGEDRHLHGEEYYCSPKQGYQSPSNEAFPDAASPHPPPPLTNSDPVEALISSLTHLPGQIARSHTQLHTSLSLVAGQCQALLSEFAEACATAVPEAVAAQAGVDAQREALAAELERHLDACRGFAQHQALRDGRGIGREQGGGGGGAVRGSGGGGGEGGGGGRGGSGAAVPTADPWATQCGVARTQRGLAASQDAQRASLQRAFVRAGELEGARLALSKRAAAAMAGGYAAALTPLRDRCTTLADGAADADVSHRLRTLAAAAESGASLAAQLSAQQQGALREARQRLFSSADILLQGPLLLLLHPNNDDPTHHHHSSRHQPTFDNYHNNQQPSFDNHHNHRDPHVHRSALCHAQPPTWQQGWAVVTRAGFLHWFHSATFAEQGTGESAGFGADVSAGSGSGSGSSNGVSPPEGGLPEPGVSFSLAWCRLEFEGPECFCIVVEEGQSGAGAYGSDSRSAAGVHGNSGGRSNAGGYGGGSRSGGNGSRGSPKPRSLCFHTPPGDKCDRWTLAIQQATAASLPEPAEGGPAYGGGGGVGAGVALGVGGGYFGAGGLSRGSSASCRSSLDYLASDVY